MHTFLYPYTTYKNAIFNTVLYCILVFSSHGLFQKINLQRKTVTRYNLKFDVRILIVFLADINLKFSFHIQTITRGSLSRRLACL